MRRGQSFILGRSASIAACAFRSFSPSSYLFIITTIFCLIANDSGEISFFIPIFYLMEKPL